MRKLLIENLEVYEQHRETVDALIAEARALREEECELAAIFSKLPETLVTSELFNHFMSDVHMAHEVFQRRIEHLTAQGTADELQNLKNDKNELDNVMTSLREDLSNTQQEASRRLARIQKLEQQVKAAHNGNKELQKKVKDAHNDNKELREQVKELNKAERKRKQNLRQRLSPVLEDDCENWPPNGDWQPNGATLSFINEMNKWIHGDICKAQTNIDHTEQNIDGVKEHLANAQNRINALREVKDRLKDVNSCAKKAIFLTKRDIEGLTGIIIDLVDHIGAISEELDRALEDLGRAREDENKAKENLNTAKEKFEPIKKRTDGASALEQLVNYLEANI